MGGETDPHPGVSERMTVDIDRIQQRATALKLRSFAAPHMRTFHLTWLAFFVAFFGWFGIAPLMPLIRDDLGLSKAEVFNTVIASVAITIVARIAIGWVLDRVGPRRTYAALLIVGAIPVMLIGLSQNYETFLLFRLAIGVIGASFVITQYHTSVMFAPNVVGTANATTAGWGNLGGGVTQLVMPLVLWGDRAGGPLGDAGLAAGDDRPGGRPLRDGLRLLPLHAGRARGRLQTTARRGPPGRPRVEGRVPARGARPARMGALSGLRRVLRH